ncbi:glycoside hydrolase family 108 protein [Saccharicrinis fermentans]|uniref:Putative peptidoglycan domain protein n=1 Tax=Saccharicrinis fermentans DSM 9555 = JCM 21142 TaxID=869213 RepID=W7YEA5_9BACT|nr:glycosyl hydrolase 108 family protein [Saccharicrinis fermentans]GAF05798.1 putative peptidoglycan domain protein [Saccharicrinis fermentans DSM 9555 = JCM 21142]
MKTFDELFDRVIKHEGYYANVAGDRGGETYMGVARNLHPNWDGWQLIDTYKETFGKIKRNTMLDIPGLTEFVKDFYKLTFHDKYKVGYVVSGSLQEIIFDWCVNSGYWGSCGVQKVLNRFFDYDLKLDGIIGKNTVKAINSSPAESLFNAIKSARINYYHTIAQRGRNHKFLKGWLRRINSISYK